MLSIRNLSIDYAGVSAVRNVSLEVAEGGITAIIGANGGGKSSLLKAVSGLVRPTAGQVEFADVDITGMQPSEIVDRGLVQVPEGRQLFPALSVLTNLELGAYLRRARRDLKTNLARVFEMFPLLADRAQQQAGLLSGGEQQMLAIGRALMASPRLMMLDEPSEGLAPLFVEKTFEILRSLSDAGLTVLIVSQEVVMTLELSRFAYVIENGHVVTSGESSVLASNDEIRASYLGL
jgi:branched-chain amino acid transport system ATP-binding protein